MQLKALPRRDAKRLISKFVANVQVIEELFRRNLSTGNTRSDHKNELLPTWPCPSSVLGLSRVAIILLIDPVILDQVF